MANKVDVSIVIPCYNEEKRISDRFSKAYKAFKKYFNSFEVILVNDGSVDKTEEVLNRFCSKYKDVCCISYRKNVGKSYALVKGVEKASGKIIGFMDADFSIFLEELPRFVKQINDGADLCIGDRRRYNGRSLSKLSLIRKLYGGILAYFNNFILNLGKIIDTQCGFKFFKGSIAKELFSEIHSTKWMGDLEVIALARQKGYRIDQLSVKWEQIQDSRVSILRDTTTVLPNLLRIYLRFAPLKTLVLAVLALLILINLPFLINPSSLTHRNGDWSDLVWPDYVFIKQTILNFHQIPFWNPTLLSGIPEIANPQSPLIYPVNILTLILPIDLGIVILIMLHVLLAAIFLYLTCRRVFNWSNLGSIVSVLGFCFSPYLWSKVAVGHLSMFFAFCLVPAIFYFGSTFFKKGRILNLFLMSVFLGLEYLNYPTIWYYTCFFGAITTLMIGLHNREYLRIVLIGLGTVFSILLVLPIFLIQFQAGPMISRSGFNLSDLEVPIWSLKRFSTSVLIPPNLLGDNETEVWLYPSIALLIVGVFGLFKLKKNYKILALTIAILIGLITLGGRTPFFGLMVRFIPGFSYLRVVTRDWFVLVLLLSFLAGWGINQMRRWRLLVFCLIFLDLIFFSTIRLWFMPAIYTKASNFSDLLMSDQNFRYYCTRRCLSARDTLPLGINTADGYHLIILNSYNRTLSLAGGFEINHYTGNIPGYEEANAQPSAEALGKISVKWLVSDNNLIDPELVKIKQEQSFYLYKNDLALPIIRFENPGSSLKILENTPDQILVQSDGMQNNLILAMNNYPGWEVRIDNRLGTIKEWDNWAISVEVAAGQHSVEFDYRPFKHL